MRVYVEHSGKYGNKILLEIFADISSCLVICQELVVRWTNAAWPGMRLCERKNSWETKELRRLHAHTCREDQYIDAFCKLIVKLYRGTEFSCVLDEYVPHMYNHLWQAGNGKIRIKKTVKDKKKWKLRLVLK